MLDIIVIGIIVISGWIGFKIGFIKTVYQLVASLISFLIAMTVYPVFSTLLKMTPLYGALQQWVSEILPKTEIQAGLQAQSAMIEEVTQWLPQFLTDYLVVNNNPEIYKMLGVSKLKDYIIISVSDFCITVLAIIIAWILIKVILAIFISILDLVSKLPILKTANQMAGILAGSFKGVLFIWLVYMVLPLLILIPQFSMIENMIQSSVIAKVFYDNNILLEIISGLLLK
ncbi:MAG: CvpA family protein [Cellulosilyticaceae bacterium]